MTLLSRFLVPSRLASAKAIAVVAVALASPLTHVSGALAESADRDKPISFSSDTGDANLQDRGGTLVGHVLVTQGTTTIRADRIVFKQNADNSLSATAYGNPVSFRQKRDGFDEYYEGYAQRIEYDGSKELLQLFDNALLKRGQDEIRSNYVSYNTATEVFKAEGRPGTEPDPTGPGARVRGMFQPKSEGEEAGKGKGNANDAAGKAKGNATDAAKGNAKAAPPAIDQSVTLKPAGELAPPPVK